MQVYGIDAAVRIVSHFAFFYLAFWGLRSLQVERFFKSLHTTQIRVTIVLFAMVIGYTASSFFLEVLALWRNIFISFN